MELENDEEILHQLISIIFYLVTESIIANQLDMLSIVKMLERKGKIKTDKIRDICNKVQ